MENRNNILAALIIGGAIVASSYQSRDRYALSAADNNVVWRMDTWSGQIDLCGWGDSGSGPVVSCGAIVIQNPSLRQQLEAPGTPESGNELTEDESATAL